MRRLVPWKTSHSVFALLLFATFFHASSVHADSRCEDSFKSTREVDSTASLSSYREVLEVMEKDPYDLEKLPTIPIRLWRFFEPGVTKGISFFVGRRSAEILTEKSDFRSVGTDKPIHPMGVGFEGMLKLRATRWSGAFQGGEFPVLARASISQGNPLMHQPNGKPVPRSTALALKIFGAKDLNQPTETANIVFQNDLNGSVGPEGLGIRWLDELQTNQPKLNVLKIRTLNEVMTLVGVAIGSFRTPKDRTTHFPYINPQIRPVHPLAELGVKDASEIRTPTWVMVQPVVKDGSVRREDFRNELIDTLERDGQIEFGLYASDQVDVHGRIVWEHVGGLVFTRGIVSKGVDRNLKFPHATLNSQRTGQPFTFPRPSSASTVVPDDIQ
jgi:hypothetical protein